MNMGPTYWENKIGLISIMSKRGRYASSSDSDDNETSDNTIESEEEKPKKSYDDWYASFLDILDTLVNEYFTHHPYEQFNDVLYRITSDLNRWETDNPMPE